MVTTLFQRCQCLLFLLAAALGGCTAVQAPSPAAVRVEQRPLARETAVCSGTFVAHTLPHTTTITGDSVTMFDSNGAGLAINDLDDDGDLDIVLANLKDKNAILWNEGGLTFRRQTLDHGQSRAVSIVDVDGDGRRDILFTRQLSGPTYWHNEGGAVFDRQYLPDVTKLAYALDWGDLDGDGDLDLVTASYDAALAKDLGNSFLLGEGAGVYFYENRDGVFKPQRLTDEAQALAVFLLDLNEDGRGDILVGNDFAVTDQVWLRADDGWAAAAPFAATTHSTMGFDSGDIDNDGHQELLATDMKPYADDATTLAAWQPVMDMMMHGEVGGDPQIMENVLQVRDANGRFENLAANYALQATGWSWSARFGDLDNDGFLDLYVVNGMAAAELFAQLPNNELVEENQALRNVQGRGFVPAAQWGLNATEGGRGMSMADLDNDGDLDIVVNNLLAPALLFENQICDGQSLEVDLQWPGSGNTSALGAQIILHTDIGPLQRTVRAGGGYLSGEPSRLHVGFPEGTRLESLEIIWPDRATSRLESVAPDTLLRVERS